MARCRICGEEDCQKHTFFLGKTLNIKEFSGSSPPEIFVGEWNYPNVYTGILSPQETGDTKLLSSHELWHENKISIADILSFRNKLIYGRTQSNIKHLQSKFHGVMKEVAMTHKSISAEFKLKKAIQPNRENNPKTPLISHAAPVDSVKLIENPQIKSKVEYLVNDVDAKSKISMLELEKANIETSSIIKLLSAGLLGLKKNRKLVPTKWAITATDDTLSKEKLKSIRLFPEIKEISLFHSEYVGNHYEFLLLPDKFSFEVIEHSLKGGGFWHDYESFFARKTYADDVTGAYYVNRLALTEYLMRIHRQASCIVFREVRPEYYAPLGVGILRQISRDAFAHQPETFNTPEDAFQQIQSRIRSSLQLFRDKSIILNNYGKQKRLNQFF